MEIFFFFFPLFGIVLESLYLGVRNVSYLCSINGFEIHPKSALHKKYSG